MCITPIASASLQEAKNQVAEKIFNLTIKQAHEQKVCINCGKPIHFYNPDHQEMVGDYVTFEESSEGDIWTWEGIREYRISALCEHCFEKITREPEEDELEESTGDMEDYGELQ